ncbi:MAG: DUF1062 domain-containing protein [Rhodospirillaceae bacterium]|nr:DUF1062 domain-containing protein [Rhodospirillaceae bacterium]
MSLSFSGPVARIQLVLTASGERPVHRHCARCKTDRPFASSGRFRVNAQKKLIDIWLIWRCTTCDQTWNQSIHERRPVRSLPPAELDAFMGNDAGLAQHHAGLLAAGMGAGWAEEVRVERRILVPMTEATARLELVVAAPPGNGLRLDRVLAMGLMLGRGEVTSLAESGALIVAGGGARALRRPAIDGQVMSVDLTRCDALRRK